MVRKRMVILALALLAMGVGSSLAATVYEAELTPENVVPSSGVDAYGQATLIVGDNLTTIDLTLNFVGLDTEQTAAKLIRATPEQPGVEMLTLPLGSPLALTLDYTAEMGEALEAGELAIQIYSEAWTAGALRGNFDFVIVPVDETTWSNVKDLFN